MYKQLKELQEENEEFKNRLSKVWNDYIHESEVKKKSSELLKELHFKIESKYHIIPKDTILMDIETIILKLNERN